MTKQASHMKRVERAQKSVDNTITPFFIRVGHKLKKRFLRSK
jgi:hypothetical protein